MQGWNKILPYIVIAVLVFLYVRSCNENEREMLIARQNFLAKTEQLAKVNDSTYQSYVKVISLNKIQKETILAQNEIILQLRETISNTVGEVIKDTVFVEVPTNCIGLRLGFIGGNSFYSYTDTVTVANPPIHKLTLSFNPFTATAYLSRNKEGIWKGTLQLSANIADHVKVESFTVDVEKDLYLQDFAPKFSLIPFFSIQSNAVETRFDIGAMGILNDTHLFGYGKSINNNFHTIMYGYKLNF